MAERTHGWQSGPTDERGKDESMNILPGVQRETSSSKEIGLLRKQFGRTVVTFSAADCVFLFF
jgi:hypothetical protein